MPVIEHSSGENIEIDRSTPLPTPDGPWQTVIDRFNMTKNYADTLLKLLVGSDGNGGYLKLLYDLIGAGAPGYTVTTDTVNTGINILTPGNPPTFDRTKLKTIPDFIIPDPSIKPLPSIDLSDLRIPPEVTDINPQIEWGEIEFSNDIYPALLARLIQDLRYGATGLTAAVQQDIFDAGIERLRIETDKKYQALCNDLGARGSKVLNGALVSAIAEFHGEVIQQHENLNRDIVITQADLAQKNSQFIIDQAVKVETLLRDTTHKVSDRALDYAKAVAMLAVQVWAEKIKNYIAIAEANRQYILVQVENLKAVVEYNVGIVEVYKAQLQAYDTKVGAISKGNESWADVYKSEVDGYEGYTRALSMINQTSIDKIKLDIANAELKLRAAIASAESALAGYNSENSLKEKIVNDMGALATQGMSAALTSVSANASLGYQGSESKSEQWSHSDQLSASHTYEHDPSA